MMPPLCTNMTLQTLRQQLDLKRTLEGVKPTPAGERACSCAPSAALLATELTWLWRKEAADLQDAVLYGTRARELANLARLRAVLAHTCLSGGRTAEGIHLGYASVWVNMNRVVAPAGGGPPRIVPTRVPLVVLALAGSAILHAYLSQPGLVLNVQVCDCLVSICYAQSHSLLLSHLAPSERITLHHNKCVVWCCCRCTAQRRKTALRHCVCMPSPPAAGTWTWACSSAARSSPRS
jgi:hypothetical protein